MALYIIIIVAYLIIGFLKEAKRMTSEQREIDSRLHLASLINKATDRELELRFRTGLNSSVVNYTNTDCNLINDAIRFVRDQCECTATTSNVWKETIKEWIVFSKLLDRDKTTYSLISFGRAAPNGICVGNAQNMKKIDLYIMKMIDKRMRDHGFKPMRFYGTFTNGNYISDKMRCSSLVSQLSYDEYAGTPTGFFFFEEAYPYLFRTK